MPSWSLHSAERQDTDAGMLRRFVEASRRAEIIALVNSVDSADELGDELTAELCEAFEAEVAFLLAARAEAPPVLIGATGLSLRQREKLLHEPLCIGALGAAEPSWHEGRELVGLETATLGLAGASSQGDNVLIGVARLYEQPFDDAELALLESISKSAAHALERAWLAADRERHATRQAALARAAKVLTESLDPAEVLSAVCEQVALATEGEIVTVYFGDDASGLTAMAGHGVPASFIGLRRAPGEGLCGRALQTGAPQVSNDYEADGLAPESTSALRDVRSALSVPLRRRGGLDGAISVGFFDGRWITEEDVELLSAFADLAGVACRNADDHAAAQRAATLDPLTGCLNHAAFQERLREEIARAERGAEPFTLVLLDLEDFKDINERFGHLSGDSVLRTVGELLRSGVRVQDQVARFGGDEFALVLPETAEKPALQLVKRLVESIGRAPTPGGRRLHSHAGMAEWQPGEPPTGVIERADQMLRDAKRARAAGEEGPQVRAQSLDTTAAVSRQQRVDQRRKRLAVAARIGSKLSRLLDLRSIAEATASELTAALDYEFAAVLRLSGDGYVAAVGTAGRGRAAGSSWALTQPRDRGAVGRCLRERRSVMVRHLGSDGDEAGLEKGMRSELAVPVHAGSELWGVIEIQSPSLAGFDEEDARLVELVADHAGAALRTAELYRNLEQTHMGVAEALAAALEAKDGYTASHARWIADLAVEVGRELELPEGVLRDVRYGAIFHDIGKIAVPDAILNKPGPLTEEEFEIIKRHSVVGEQILAPVPFLSEVRRIVRHDHERWDGTGYPDGLRGPRIPIGARIVFVVDAYHAMVSDRPYRKAMPEAEARERLKAEAGTQFDPNVVEAFVRVLDRLG
jgi:diguanylate cyclase (GGDEF)-like protein